MFSRKAAGQQKRLAVSDLTSYHRNYTYIPERNFTNFQPHTDKWGLEQRAAAAAAGAAAGRPCDGRPGRFPRQ